MKRQYFFWVFGAVLVAGTALILFPNRWNTVASDFNQIIFDQSDKVNSVSIFSSRDSLTLQRNGNEWHFPDGEILNAEAAGNLLAAMEKIRPVSVMKSGEVEMEDPVRVVFKRNDRELHSFYTWHTISSVFVTAEPGDQVYSVEIPGYSVATLQKIFSDNPDHYREHLLLDYLPREIRVLEINPFSGPSFRIVQDTAAGFRFLGPDGETDITDAVSEHEVRMLFSYLNTIRYERRLLPGEVPPELDPGQPDAGFTVQGTDGELHEFKVWKWYREGSPEPDLFKALVIYNRGPEILVVNYRYLDLILREMGVYTGS